jgi:hypothetical protein
VYALGHRKLTDQGWLAAALLYSGKGAALSHDIGAWWWEIVKPRPTRLDVSAPGFRSSLPAQEIAGRMTSPAVLVHHPRKLERVFHRGLPITTPARTLLDIAPTCPRRQLRRALAETFYRRLATPDEVRAVLGRGHAGSRALRAALDSHVPQLERTKSGLEDEFLALCERAGLPLPEINSEICGYEVDAVFRAERVAVELDGESAHGAAGAVHRDRARDLALRASGWLVRRYSWQQVFHEPDLVAADLVAALAGATDPQAA